MISKEQAREIYNHYSQIDETNKAISNLRKVVENKTKEEPKNGIITDKYSFSGSIKLEIPTSWEQQGYLGNGLTIHDISIVDAILVLENHVVRLQKELEELQKQAIEE